MNRSDFQQLADDYIEDATVLLDAQRYASAYYLAGYSVECALKAVIAAQSQGGDFPRKDAAKLYVHNLSELLIFARLGQRVRNEIALDATLPGVDTGRQESWRTLADWSEDTRYERIDDAGEAQKLINAISDPMKGILIWIKTFW